MYFWKTNLLAQDIKSNSITDEQWKNYYLASSIITTLSLYIVNFSPRTGTPIFFEIVAMVAIIIFGINITYKTNSLNGSSASNYISRICALSLPLTIKIFLTSFIFGLTIGVIFSAIPDLQNLNDILLTIFTIFIQIFYFWRINVHLKSINT